MPLFSIIIPTYNRLQFLQEAIGSIKQQQFTDYEVIIVDDGSIDGTKEWLNTAGSNILAISQNNRGPGAARNLGAHLAKGEYLAFLDSDDVWFPWTLETFSALVKQYNNPAIISAKLQEFYDESDLRKVVRDELLSKYYLDYFTTSKNAVFVGAGMSVINRREFLNKDGFTQNNINCEDHDLIMRLGTAKGFVQILAPVTLGWRKHRVSLTNNVLKTFQGSYYLVKQEEIKKYPGGKTREFERITILSMHVRPVTLDCLKQGFKGQAWRLFSRTLFWHIRLSRWRYIFGWLALALLPAKSILGQIKQNETNNNNS